MNQIQNDPDIINIKHSQAVFTRWLIGLIAIIVLVLVGGGIWFYDQQSQAIRKTNTDQLNSIAELKIGQIVQWKQERLGDAQINSQSPFFRMAIKQWLKNPQDAGLKANILEKLQLVMKGYNYQNVLLATPDSRLLLSVNGQISQMDADKRMLASEVVASGQPQLGDFYRDSNSNQVELDVAAPIPDENKQTVAVLILQIDPQRYLYPLLQSWLTPSQSAETLLVQRDGADVLFLNPLRHSSAPPMTLRIPLSSTNVPAVQAVLGKTGVFEGYDYRGVDVLSEIYPVPGTPWFMVAKIDTDEVFAGMRRLGLEVLLFVLLAGLMAFSVAGSIFNNRRRLLYRGLLQSEQERRQALEETRTTLYSIGDGVITTGPAGRVTRLNPVAETLTGWSESEALGLPLSQVFHILNEQTRAEVENPVERVLQEGLVIGLANHTLLVARDGTERPIADSGAPIRDEQGNISGVVLVFRDQSQERAAQKERALLTDTMRASLNEIYLYDASTLRFRFVNDGALRNLGYTLDQIQNMTIPQIKTEFTPKTFQQLISPLLEHRQPALVFETVHRRADGSLYPVEVYLQLFEYPDEQVFLMVAQDITARKQAEQALIKSEAMLLEMGKMGKIGAWEFDAETLEQTWTEEVYRIHEVDQTYNPSVSDGIAFYAPASRAIIERVVQRAIEYGEAYDEELEIITAKGNHRWVHTIGKPKQVQGKTRIVSGTFQDITNRKRAEDEIRQLNAGLEQRVRERTIQLESANTELEAFAYSVSHDLRAPLRAMDGFSAALLKDYPDRLDEQGRHYLERIQEASRRMGQLINDLLTLSRVTRTEFKRQQVDLSLLAREIIAALQTQQPQRLVVFDIAHGLVVQGDAHLLKIALENLLNNAYKFTGQCEQAQIQVGVMEQAGESVYFVRDNGVGFDMDYADKLFTPFQRLHSTQEFPGTGIGLVTVQRIIHRHGGRIWPEAALNQGATFYFTLGGE